MKHNVVHEVRRYTSTILHEQNVARIRRAFVASGLAPDVKDNVARTVRSFVIKGNVAHEVRRYTNTTLDEQNVARIRGPSVASGLAPDVKDKNT